MFKILKILIVLCIIFLVFVVGYYKTALTSVTSREQIEKCIIGEATEDGYLGMKAVALVYRNRISNEMNLGCVSLNRKDIDEFIAKEGKVTEEIAHQIVKEVFIEWCEDITMGATHYENIEKYVEPFWVPDMIITTKIGSHTFYKEK